MQRRQNSGPKTGDVIFGHEITLRDAPRPASRSPASSIASSDGRSVEHRLRAPDKFAVVDGITLNHYREVIVDFCAMTVTAIDLRGDRLKILKRLLRQERIKFRSLAPSHPLHKSTIRLKTPEDFQIFLCKIGRRH